MHQLIEVEVVTLVDAEPAVVFDLELDVDVHAASVPGSDETAIPPAADGATCSSTTR